MALIIDPDLLLDGKEISILTGSKTVKLTITGNLSQDGTTLKCVYSKTKELWQSSSIYIAYPFPFTPITDEQFEIGAGWDWDKSISVSGTEASGATVNLLRTGGWALKNAGGTTVEEWAGIVTLGTLTFDNANNRVYYQQQVGGAAKDVILQVTGGVNQAVQTYQGASGTYTSYFTATADLRSYFKVFSREYKYTYADSDLGDIGVNTMTYQVYRFPLTNQGDTNIEASDLAMTGSPYSGMSITYHTSSYNRSGLVGGTFPFKVIIAGNSGTTKQIYEYVQYQLRQNSDIDAGDELTQVIGKTAPALLQFVGSTLYTLQYAAGTGTFIDAVNAVNINDVYFVDDSGTNRYYPYSAVLTLQFGSNLTADNQAIYRVFFTNDNPPGDDLGYDFGTANAITVNDFDGNPMTGFVSGSASIQKTFDYDGNVQRGVGSSGSNAPITVVAIGLGSAQYVLTEGTITRTKTNAASLVAPLERNYSNP